jgi:hypothetical protein
MYTKILKWIFVAEVIFGMFLWVEGSIRSGHLLNPDELNRELDRFARDAAASALGVPKQ